MSVTQLKAYNLNPNSQVWTEGMPQWVPAYTVPELMMAIKGSQQPVYPAQQPYNPNTPPPNAYQNNAVPSGKDHIVAGILALLLGGFGAQYFYMGKTTAGLYSLGITFISLILSLVIIGIFLLWVWGILLFVQGIMILCMNQETFDAKFVNNPSVMPLF